jgi:uncharacterized phage-associated protein
LSLTLSLIPTMPASATNPASTVAAVTAYILRFAHDRGSFVSNLKLQKLLYYSQGWHMALNDRQLFSGRFEAWVHGPVISSVYQEYKGFAWRNIDVQPEGGEVGTDVAEFLNELLEEYLPLDAYELEMMTHREPPWINARQGLPPEARSTAQLSESEMQAYFRSIAIAPK